MEDTVLRVFDADGTQLFIDDDSGAQGTNGIGDARLERLSVVEAGTYFFEAASYRGGFEGGYRFTL